MILLFFVLVVICKIFEEVKKGDSSYQQILGSNVMHLSYQVFSSALNHSVEYSFLFKPNVSN